MSKQSVLVLGADQIIGKQVIAALYASDWAAPFAPSGSLAGDIAKADAIVNAVIGSAAVIRRHTEALFTAAKNAGQKPRIVHLSSMTVYGSANGVMEETASLLGDVSEYAAAQVEAERLASSFGRAVIFRPGCEYGPGCAQWSKRIARWLIARRIGDLGASGDGYCNLVHIDDVVKAIVIALRADAVEGQAFNLGLPRPPTWNEYLMSFGKALGAVPVRRIGARRLAVETKLLAPPLKVAEIFTQRIGLPDLLPSGIPPSFLRLCMQEIRLDVRKAEDVLGMQWTPLADGLRSTAHWLRERA